MKWVDWKTLVPFIGLIVLVLFVSIFAQNRISKSEDKGISITEQVPQLAPSISALSMPLPAPLPIISLSNLANITNSTNVTNVLHVSILPVIVPPTLPAIVPPCIPNTIPAIISASINLCGTITMTSSTKIASSNVIVTCNLGTVISKAINNIAHDGIQISSGLTNVSIIGCSFSGKFSNAINIGPGVTNSLVVNNRIDGSSVGINEEFLAQFNQYSGNTITNSGTGMQLEGTLGQVIFSSISRNTVGILTGTNPAKVNSATPNAVCSSGFIPYSCPSQQGQPIACSIPRSGQAYYIQSNDIRDNVKGIVTWSLDNRLLFNTIRKNSLFGIESNGIYIGSEINPSSWVSQACFMFNVQEYFQSGSQIFLNDILQNGKGGIQLSGRSNYFYQSSVQYRRWTLISDNIITASGQDGIVVGTFMGNDPYNRWNEYTNIRNNDILNNGNDGVVLLNPWMTDVLQNNINYNTRNGISLGSNMAFSYSRYIFQNNIKNNLNYGIYLYNGLLQNVILNEINNNKKGIYVPEDPSGSYTQTASSIICNDISYNIEEGFNYDAKWSNPANSMFGSLFVASFVKNRILRNGADGVRYYLDMAIPVAPYVFQSLPQSTFNNLIQENGFNPNPNYLLSGYGLNVDGGYDHGFFKNSFVGNNLGPAHDSGSIGIENIYDEWQYELAYDNVVCKNCGGPCVTDGDCGWYSGTCVNNICQAPPGSGLSCNLVTGNVDCYANPSSLPVVIQLPTYGYGAYNPRGNYGLPIVIPTSASPPLMPTSCGSHSQCATHSCEMYPPPVSNIQCGNGNRIPEPSIISGYYQPGIICPNIYGYWPPYFGNIPPTAPHNKKSALEPPEELEFGVILEDSIMQNRLYEFLPKVYGESQMFKEIMKDRTYIESQNNPINLFA